VLLIWVGRYKLLEYTQALFVAVLGIGAVVSVIMIKPDILEMIPNFFFIGNIPSYPSWVDTVEGFNKTPILLTMLGYLGTLTISLVPLVGYLGWIKVKKWGIFKNKEDAETFSHQLFNKFRQEGKITYLPVDREEIRKSYVLLKPILIDLGIAFVLVSIISASYMVAGKYLLGPQSDGSYLLPSDINLIQEQGIIFSHIASWLEPLFKVSVFFALFGTVYAGFEAASRMLYETWRGLSKKMENTPYSTFMFYLLMYILVISIPLAILMSLGLSVLLVLSLTLLFIGVVGVIIYGFGAIYISQTVLPENYRLEKRGLIIAIIGVFLLLIPMVFLFA
jgi:hypothetical protein